jgi:hypothetical protein
MKMANITSAVGTSGSVRGLDRELPLDLMSPYRLSASPNGGDR